MRRALLTGLLLAPAAAADDLGLARDELRFAESLARYRYFDLALDEVLPALRARSTTDEFEGALDAAEAAIRRRAAESTSAPAELGRAIEILEPWARAGSVRAYHPQRLTALDELAAALHARARLLAEQDSPRAGADFQRADEVLAEARGLALEQAEAARRQMRADEAEVLAARARATLIDRGLNALAWSQLDGDRTARLEEASALFGEFQWEAEEGQLRLYEALHLQGLAEAGLQRLDEARALQEEVLVDVRKLFWEHLAAYPPAARVDIARLFDATHLALARLRAGADGLATGTATLEDLLAAHDAAGQPLGASGTTVLLDWLDELPPQERWRHGLPLARRLAQEAPDTPPGARAARLLADPTLVAELERAGLDARATGVLLLAAQGFERQRDLGPAAYAYGLATTAAPSPAERCEGYLGLGRCLQQDGRQLEAGLAFEQAADAAHEAQLPAELALAASGCVEAFDRRYRETGLAFDKELRDAARRRFLALGIESTGLELAAALELFEAAEAAARALQQDASSEARQAVRQAFVDAAAALQAITEDAPGLVRAHVYRARALAGAGRAEDALAAFADLRARTAEPDDPTLAEALSSEAHVLLGLSRPADALALLEGFERRFPDQPAAHELVQYQRVLAELGLGDLDAAESALAALESRRPDSPSVPDAAFRLALALDEHARAAPQDGLSLRLRAAAALWKASERSAFASFANLLRAGDWYRQGEAWDEAQRCYETALERCAGARSEDDLDDARLGLAATLDERHEFGRSRPVWTELLQSRPREGAVLTGAARGFGGWLEQDATGAVVEIPGSGDAAQAFALWTEVLRGSAQDKHSRRWWQAKLGVVYALYRMGDTDPRSFADARRVLEDQRLHTPLYDAETLGQLAPSERYAPLFQPLFEYLERKIPRS